MVSEKQTLVSASDGSDLCIEKSLVESVQIIFKLAICSI